MGQKLSSNNAESKVSSKTNVEGDLFKSDNKVDKVKSDLLKTQSCRGRRQRKKKRIIRCYDNQLDEQFGYNIGDIDEYLLKATIDTPANIPVVLAYSAVLYRTKIGGYQEEVHLPLGMVVNAIFKNQNWLYVQTPHGEEGYIDYHATMPLGILPNYSSPSPCWDNSTDIFPRPSGNLSSSECSGSTRFRRTKSVNSVCSEHHIDRIYMESAKRGTTLRQTLLAIGRDYARQGGHSIAVRKGEVVVLLNADVEGWFWVKKRNGVEGFIPADVAGNGYL